MKKHTSQYLIAATIITAMLFAACTNNTKTTTDTISDVDQDAQLDAQQKETAAANTDNSAGKLAIAAYIELKDALVESSIEKAQAAAAKVSEYLGKHEVIKAQAAIITESSDIDAHRAAFETMSVSLYDNLKAEGSATLLYKQYCPMAFNNTGAFWLSDKEEIRNPYFGDKMLKCGSVKETIAAND
jgi:hypothetical protein